MMYQNKMVVCIKVGGKILRELNGVVRIPFGSDYSIFLKNLNSRKSVVTVYIDGDSVLDGKKVIVGAKESVELNGFIDGMVTKNKFRFIERTTEIENHRGVKAEDSLVRIEFQFEEDQPQFTYTYTIPCVKYPYYVDWNYTPSIFTTQSKTSQVSDGIAWASCSYTSTRMPEHATPTTHVVSDAGITVEGEETFDQYQYGNIGQLENDNHTIVLRLSGYYNKTDEMVEEPVFIRTKKICKTCGRSNDYTNKFCFNCGTFLK